MKLVELVDSLTHRGWRQFYRSSGNDRAWLRHTTNEITIETMVRPRLLSKNFAIGTTNHFCKKEHYETVLKIHNLKKNDDRISSYMFANSNSYRFEINSTPAEVAATISDELIDAAKYFDYHNFLKTCIDSRPDRGLEFQQNHITALAIKGEYEKLMDYLDSFKNGHRLNFLDPISTDMIDRALDIALINSDI